MWVTFIITLSLLITITMTASAMLGGYIGRRFVPIQERPNYVGKALETRITRRLRINEREKQTWFGYAKDFLTLNLLFLLIGYVLLRFQGVLPFNPNGAVNLDWHLAFHTVISFMTNTDQQHYSGEALSHLSQMFVLSTLMFVAPTMALTMALAFIRAILGKQIGQFYFDFVRVIVYVLLPISLFFGMWLIAFGVPQTLSPNTVVTTIEGASQTIQRGPIASFEVIKQLGNNGGGYYAVNGAHPFENPSKWTNYIHLFLMLLLPMSLPFIYGSMAKKRKQGFLYFGVMLFLFVIGTVAMYATLYSNPSLHGQEMRFGEIGTALYGAVTTAAETGAVNAMHDSLPSLSGIILMGNMMLNVVFGGVGAGFMNLMMYVIITIFVAALLIGQTPTVLGKKIEGREMKLVALTLLVSPLLILGFTALALVVQPGQEAITNAGPHGISQILYEYTSAVANNGSGFEGLLDATPFWNITAGFAMFFGRYIPLLLMVAMAGSLQMKPRVTDDGALRTDTPLFTSLLFGVIVIVGALTFLPVLLLGPFAEWLMIR
ncbi:potassium-transporting ATPase subunit KdpA [Exiguobacterium profundum]|uniref:potassium-transporting ATPase subunit KdpA n=1 Tax=Exiguobacterium profundum TaxID=307643 RepID=UPI002AA6881B|nr:potassium-transporting ATPase subunit KdpA [Exiguobacterium profundum]